MDVLDIARYLGALLIVIALVGLAGLAARRYGVPGVVKGTTTRRLSVIETLMVAPRYKLLLVRRDDVDHLVLVGPQGANVIETGVPAIAAAPQVSALAPPETPA